MLLGFQNVEARLKAAEVDGEISSTVVVADHLGLDSGAAG